MRLNILKYLNVKLCLPLFEIAVNDSARKPFPADPDALQHAVTAKLMDNQGVLHHTYDENSGHVYSCFSEGHTVHVEMDE